MLAAIDSTILTPAKEALDKAKIRLMGKADSVFFTTLCFSMKHVWSIEVPTAACNGKTIYWNPSFFMSLGGPEEHVFLLLHETMHAAYLHMDPVRMNGRCPDKWNIACDHVINLQLIARGFKMPTGANAGFADPIYTGLSAEEVYKLLPANPGKPNMVDLMAPPGDLEQIRSDMQDILVRASIQSKMSEDKVGTIPGEIEIFLNKLLSPKLPWHRILQKYLQAFAKDDYTFKKPNRRFFPKHHLPSLFSVSLIDLAIAVDTSGSVSDTDFLRFISETHGILKMMKPKKISFLQFDTEIKSVHQLKSIRDLEKVAFTGRGGTYITPVIEWANENKPQLLLVFTDGGFSFYGLETSVNTLWLIHENTNFRAPFGKTIHYTI
jgi:predicted metal-dependent peptidase